MLLLATAATHALCFKPALLCFCKVYVAKELDYVANAHFVTVVGYCCDRAAAFQVWHLVLWQRQHQPRTCSDQLKMV